MSKELSSKKSECALIKCHTYAMGDTYIVRTQSLSHERETFFAKIAHKSNEHAREFTLYAWNTLKRTYLYVLYTQTNRKNIPNNNKQKIHTQSVNDDSNVVHSLVYMNHSTNSFALTHIFDF